ncbi:hypothetical protein PISMIDRAFT_677392 [Pisolithus microcarpus 441]|uniref:Uncharacterized protein n=1 Tax=Pisolithus microcarpus 441 TaxID=765257 RepID=A0A0C9YJM9_9AGAM|nr:hypothetical protein PISMIDRAFT_677392 [Pisolithus microcarpus 441]
MTRLILTFGRMTVWLGANRVVPQVDTTHNAPASPWIPARIWWPSHDMYARYYASYCHFFRFVLLWFHDDPACLSSRVIRWRCVLYANSSIVITGSLYTVALSIDSMGNLKSSNTGGV